jgi:hypothetical protein
MANELISRYASKFYIVCHKHTSLTRNPYITIPLCFYSVLKPFSKLIGKLYKVKLIVKLVRKREKFFLSSLIALAK